MVFTLWKKKGRRDDITKYRGISLLSSASRVTARICSSRLMAWAEETGLLELEQGGFRSYRRTIDATVLIRCLVETATPDFKLLLEEAVAFVLAYTEKAYLMASREFSWAAFPRLGITPQTCTRVAGLRSCAQRIEGMKVPRGDLRHASWTVQVSNLDMM